MFTFSQVTVPPESIMTVLGAKQLSVSSQPGVDEPSESSTVACSPDDSSGA